MSRNRKVLALLLLVFATAIAQVAGAQDRQKFIVDGETWLASSMQDRKSFLVGAANMVALEQAYATKKGVEPSVVSKLTREATRDITLDQLIQRITQWYEANPQRRDVPVMGVIWIDIVKPASGDAK